MAVSGGELQAAQTELRRIQCRLAENPGLFRVASILETLGGIVVEQRVQGGAEHREDVAGSLARRRQLRPRVEIAQGRDQRSVGHIHVDPELIRHDPRVGSESRNDRSPGNVVRAYTGRIERTGVLGEPADPVGGAGGIVGDLLIAEDILQLDVDRAELPEVNLEDIQEVPVLEAQERGLSGDRRGRQTDRILAASRNAVLLSKQRCPLTGQQIQPLLNAGGR